MNETNLTKIGSLCKYNEDSATEKIAKVTASFFLGGFGISGNVFVIVLAVKYTVKSRLHFLIINMAVADTLFVIMNLFRYIIVPLLANSSWNNMDTTTTNIFRFFLFLSASDTFLSLLIISIERYRVTRRTVQISRPLSVKRRMAVIAGSWLISIVINIPLVVYNSKISHITFPLYLAIMLGYYSTITLLSTLTLRRLSRPQAIEESLSEVQRQQRKKRICNAVKMVLYSLLLYSCGYGPWFITQISFLLKAFKGLCFDRSTLTFFTWYFFPLANSCLSPIIYCVCLSDFRDAARRLLCSCGNTQPNLERQNNGAPRT